MRRFWWSWGPALSVIATLMLVGGVLTAAWTSRSSVEADRVRALGRTNARGETIQFDVRAICAKVGAACR